MKFESITSWIISKTKHPTFFFLPFPPFFFVPFFFRLLFLGRTEGGGAYAPFGSADAGYAYGNVLFLKNEHIDFLDNPQNATVLG